VALDRAVAQEARSRLSDRNIKGKRFRMRFMNER
jgi:hypothetical protein